MMSIFRPASWLLSATTFVSLAFGQPQLDLSPPLSVDVEPPPGQTVIIPLTLTNTGAEQVKAVTFDFTFPTANLTYVGLDTVGTLTGGWTQMSGQENTPGVVSILGFGSVAAAQTGVLVNVTFQSKDQSGVGLLQLSNFQDHVAGATTTDGTLNSTVPVELASFSAQIADQAVELSWLTISESNNFGFDVEESADGEAFTKIGFVKGHGTTLAEQRYQFIDSDVRPGAHYYRLRQIDFDGAFEYSSTLQVNMAAPQTFALAQNYPNPFNPETAIQFAVPEAASVQVTIYNALGRAVRTLVNGEFAPGTHSVTWDGRDDNGQQAASGLYLYTVKAGKFVQTRKMIMLQ